MISAAQLLRGPSEPTTLDRPLDHLMACHRRIEERLATLERVGEHFEARPAEARAALDGAFRFFDTNGVNHTADEEDSLFPRLRIHLDPGEESVLASLEHQHQEAERLYSELKQVAAALPTDLPRYRNLVSRLATLYREHIATEDRDLVALARRVLSDSELAAISAEMIARRRAPASQ